MNQEKNSNARNLESWKVIDFIFPTETVRADADSSRIDIEDALGISFRDMIAAGENVRVGELTNPRSWRDTLRICGPFQRILISEGFVPLLIEVAAIQDRRAKRTGVGEGSSVNFFVSHYASYLDATIRGSASLLTAWHDTVAAVVRGELNDTHGNPLADVVPNIRTYEFLFGSVPFVDGGFDVQVAKEDIDRITTKPMDPDTPTEIAKYEFAPIVPDQQLSDLNTTISTMAKDMVRRLDSDPSIMAFLRGARLVIVPFFRLIDYAVPEELQPLLALTGDRRPGGCVFAVVVPRNDAAHRDPKECLRLLRRASVRISWLLKWLAFSEAESKLVYDRRELVFQEALLRKIAHAIWNPLRPVRTEFPAMRREIDRLVASSELADEEKAALTTRLDTLIRQSRQAYAAASCITIFVRQNPTRSMAERREFVRSELKTDWVSLSKLFDEFRHAPMFAGQVSLEVKVEPELDTMYVEGTEEAWWLVFHLLLKNAYEASDPGSTVTVSLVYDMDIERASVVIKNDRPVDFDERTRAEMNYVLKGSRRFMLPNEHKADSMGVGLATVGQILSAWNLLMRKFTATESEVVFTLQDIPFEPE